MPVVDRYGFFNGGADAANGHYIMPTLFDQIQQLNSNTNEKQKKFLNSNEHLINKCTDREAF